GGRARRGPAVRGDELPSRSVIFLDRSARPRPAAERWGALGLMARWLLARVMGTHAGAFGLVTVVLLLVVAVAPPPVALHDPNAIAPVARLQPPSLAHIFGTDHLGRDLYSRVVYGTRIAIGVSIVVMSISLSVGILLGVGAAYAPRAIDQLILSIFDIIN